jgi:ABC-2 type transport system ATP-binding protein
LFEKVEFAMAESPNIVCENLARWYGEVVALSDLSFSSSEPLLGLLGPNGAGKSTLIKIMVGLLRPSRGKISIMGEPPRGNLRLLGGLGYVPEHHRFYPELTPRQFLLALLELNGYRGQSAEKLALEALEKTGLSARMHSPIGSLSHGMRGRLKIAQAIAHRPRWLVLDEPLNGLDPIGRLEMSQLMKELAHQGAWLVVSSHILHEIEALTSEILVINKGRLLAQGNMARVRELIDSHPHRIMIKTPQPRELGREMVLWPHLSRLEFESGGLVAETRQPDEFYDSMGQLAAAGEFSIEAMVSLDDNLEAVFRYLVG